MEENYEENYENPLEDSDGLIHEGVLAIGIGVVIGFTLTITLIIFFL